jgi:hypothetical protein
MRQGRCAGHGPDRGAGGLRVDGEDPFDLDDVPELLCVLLDLEPPFADFCFFDFGAALRLPCFCVHFITVCASVSNSAVTCSSVFPAQTASRIFLHDGLFDDFASADMGHDVHTMSPAKTIRKQISRQCAPG